MHLKADNSAVGIWQPWYRKSSFDAGKAERREPVFFDPQGPPEPGYGVGLSTPVLTVCVLVFAL